jgi:hypothetical protein
MNFAYNLGVVTKFGDGLCEIDFGDTLVEYQDSEIAYVYNTHLGLEHHMSIEPGRLISDYRSDPSGLDQGDDPVLASFNDLLARI